MDGKAIHRCLHVLDLEKSIAFYEKALGMTEIRRMGPEDGSWTNVFMGSDASGFQLELTWNRGIYFIEDPDGCWLEILPNKAEFAPQGGVDVLDAMARRRSLRRYSGEPVPQVLLDRILEAGLRSASGRSRRPWELIVVRDRAMLDDLAECREQGAGMLAGADAAIVVVADPTLADTWVEDCSIVMANMQLEAAASGVGSCWIQGRLRQAADGRSTHEFVANLLKVPAPYQLEAILSLGMPGAEAPRRPFDEALLGKVHKETF